MSASAAGQLLTSRTVRDLTIGSQHRFESLGYFDLQGLPEPVELFAVE